MMQSTVLGTQLTAQPTVAPFGVRTAVTPSCVAFGSVAFSGIAG